MIGGGESTIYRQLARGLEAAIDRGDIAVGDLLPTESIMAQRYGVSRHTVRQALRELRSRNLIESKQGVGSVVVRRKASTAHIEAYSSIEELTRFAQGTPIRAYDVQDVVADSALAARLRGRRGQSYIRVAGLRYADPDEKEAVGHVLVHVDATFDAIRTEAWHLQVSILETLERVYGIESASIEQEVSVCVLSEDLATRLGVPGGTPALNIKRWYSATNGRIFEVSDSCYPMGRFVYRNILKRRDERSG